jgi:GNAT superfamily N-acetyltransferase
LSLPADSVRIVPLDPTHDRSGFTCGVESLDRYIREQARQDSSRDIARVFVATMEEEPTSILGYYTLSAAMIGPSHLPPDVARRMPRHPVPAALVGRLAVDRRQAGRGLGTILVADAVLRTDTAARSLGIAVVVVDPLGDDARRFYRGFGFREAVGSDQMFLVRKVAPAP